MSAITTHFRKCNLCEAMCGIAIRHRGDEILSIRGNPKDPISHGHICSKAVALQDIHNDPERLKSPMRRTDSGWEAVDWETAFQEAATGLQAVQTRHGADAVGIYLGNPNAHSFANTLFLPGFFKALGSRSRFSASSADQWPHHFASVYMLGHPMLIPVPDIDRARFMLIIGANPVVSNGSMMTAPGFAKRLKALQARGGRVVVVDPRRTETAAKADQHIFIRPETDALLLMALVHVITKEGHVRLGHLEPVCKGLSELTQAAQPFTPEAVAAATGVSAGTIRQLANDMMQPGAVCYSRMGACTQAFGGICQWLTNALNIITGNFDSEGGAMFTSPAFDLVALNPQRGRPDSYGRYRSAVRGLPSFLNEFPVAALAEDMLAPGNGRLRGLVTVAGNPVLSTPAGHRLDTAMDSLEYMVAVDPYLNETTRHANLILPPAVGLETSQFDIFFNLFSVRNTVSFSEPLFKPAPTQRHDWQILKALAAALTSETPRPHTPEQMLDASLAAGPLGERGVNLAALRAMPHGLDLGPMTPNLTARLQTDDGCIHLAPQRLVGDVARLARMLRDSQQVHGDYPLQLIGRRLPRSHNTWLHNAYRLVKGKNQCTLLMHPDDAAQLGVTDGATVAVRSSTGRIEIEASVSDEMMSGVVSMPQGWGHNRKGTRQSVAASHAGASINDLTDPRRIDALTGNAAFNGVRVAVETL